MTFWGRLSVRDIGLWPFWGHLSLWNTSLWPSKVVCLCGLPAHDLLRSFVCAEYRIMTFLRSFVCGLQPFWGRLSLWNNSLWPSEVVCLCDYNLFEVVCPFGIPAHDLCVCVGYQIMTFRGRLSVWVTSSWPFEVICLCGISDYDLFWGRLSLWNTQLMTFWGHLSVDYNLVEYQLMTFWGRLSVRDIGLRSFWGRFVLLKIPAHDLLRSFVCAEYRITTFLRSSVLVEYQLMTFWGHLSVDYNLFKVVCPCGITAYDLLRSFVCAGYRITVFLWSFCPFGIPAYDLLRSFGCVGYQLMTFWGHLSVQNTGLRPFWGRLSFWNTSSWPFEVVCLCGIPDYNLFEVVCPFENTSSWPFEVVCLCGIPDHDLLRSSDNSLWPSEVVCLCEIPDYDLLEYQLMTFWGPLSVRNIGLWPFWGRLSFWNTSSWLWGRLSVRNIGFMTFWGRLSVWYTALMTFEVICFCGITGLWPKDHPSVCIRSFDLDFLQPLQGSAFAESAQDFFFVPIILLEGWSLVSPFSIWEFMMDCIPFPDLHDYGEGQRG